MVNFNFTGFMDYESGITRYEWGIGSKSGQADVVPLMPVTAARVLKDIKFSGGTQKMFVTPVVSSAEEASMFVETALCAAAGRRGCHQAWLCIQRAAVNVMTPHTRTCLQLSEALADLLLLVVCFAYAAVCRCTT